MANEGLISGGSPPKPSLCQVCGSFPFYKAEPPCDPRSCYLRMLRIDAPRMHLGTLDQISHRDCVLCRLILIAVVRIQEAEEIRYRPDQEVRLEWKQNKASMAPNILGVGYFQLRVDEDIAPHITRLSFQHDSTTPLFRPNCYFLGNFDSRLDFGRVDNWMLICKQDFLDTSYRYLRNDRNLGDIFPGLRIMRFIDVRHECLVETSSFCQYVALSYVWGTTSMLQLSKNNRSRLMQQESLSELQSRLPLTIQDAIDLVRRMDEVYLWVDTLCLIQNDSDDIRAGTDVMDLIYENSVVTIVAACGKDANAGLPGVQPNTRIISDHVAEVIPGLSLGIYTSLDARLLQSVYSSRAWTLQEYLLSRRALVFVDNRVFLRCNQDVYSENTLDSVAPSLRGRYKEVPQLSEDNTWILAQGADATMTQKIHCLDGILGDYTSRALTYPGDVLRAISGILRRISSEMGVDFFQGIPLMFWNIFLGFRGGTSSPRRRKGFPSYSWTGWVGKVVLPVQSDRAWRALESFIVWYSRNPPGSAQALLDRVGKRVAQDDRRTEKRIKVHLSTMLDLGEQVHQTHPSDRSHERASLPEYPVLQFWTVNVFLEVCNVDVLQGTGQLRDSRGKACGHLHMDSYDETPFFVGEGPFEFILLSRGESPWYWDTIYAVMCIEWNAGIAERRGVGEVTETSLPFGFAPATWTEIILG